VAETRGIKGKVSHRYISGSDTTLKRRSIVENDLITFDPADYEWEKSDEQAPAFVRREAQDQASAAVLRVDSDPPFVELRKRLGGSSYELSSHVTDPGVDVK